ncbi:MAG TPA: hypothetical protein VEA41_05790 [Salinarimonas sp.]|nr:hypothetical protein [Salinarimonas sp.]
MAKFRVTGLWVRDRGPKMSGSVSKAKLLEGIQDLGEDVRVAIWPNDNATNPKAPQYYIVLEDPRPTAEPGKPGTNEGDPSDRLPF